MNGQEDGDRVTSSDLIETSLSVPMKAKRVGSQVTRHFAILLAASLLASGLVLNPAGTKTVGACGWGIEAVSTNSVWTYDNNIGGPTSVTFQLITYNDGCGSRYYYISQAVNSGTPAHLHFQLRVWVCGNYQGTWVWDSWLAADWWVTGAYFYGACSRQADDAGSWADSGWFSPTPVGAYVAA